MQSPPPDLPPARVLAIVRDGWRPGATAAGYLPVGFGSHHWRVEDDDGRACFASADAVDGPGGWERLAGAFGVAAAARAAGVPEAHGPVPGRDGTLLARSGLWAVSVQPWLEGEAGRFSDRWSDAEAEALVRLLAGLHGVRHAAPPEEPDLPGRPALDGVLAAVARGRRPDGGPLGPEVADVLAPRLGALRRELRRLDASVACDPGRVVVTHGEPHPGNVVRTGAGPRLVDWDTARAAEPERDLWLVAARTDLDVAALYAELTGRLVDPERMAGRERRWALADVASFVPALLAASGPDADTAWQLEALGRTLEAL
ncbi:phosphotransferase [Phycicoccus sonneratiae]|uniref:Aminoglycoside phosphotransferase family protein n=1 Tax=Phycicoccus sonneratiae TaxID=2807628 RepID=A0ABS2CHC2_9MICO|nr:aminoglycoside phosphotransferase family protein [Phycicoccus sonneraticus]MBM6399269.1 aminoglycoside phosphotransferase family protein [Phycicoccus sonneraticus]